MLDNVMMMASAGLGLLIVWKLWRRFSWFRSLVKSILTFGLAVFAICTAIMYLLAMNASIGFFELGRLYNIYLVGMPIMVLIAVIVGQMIFAGRARDNEAQHYGTQSPTEEKVKKRSFTQKMIDTVGRHNSTRQM